MVAILYKQGEFIAMTVVAIRRYSKMMIMYNANSIVTIVIKSIATSNNKIAAIIYFDIYIYISAISIFLVLYSRAAAPHDPLRSRLSDRPGRRRKQQRPRMTDA